MIEDNSFNNIPIPIINKNLISEDSIYKNEINPQTNKTNINSSKSDSNSNKSSY